MPEQEVDFRLAHFQRVRGPNQTIGTPRVEEPCQHSKFGGLLLERRRGVARVEGRLRADAFQVGFDSYAERITAHRPCPSNEPSKPSPGPCPNGCFSRLRACCIGFSILLASCPFLSSGFGHTRCYINNVGGIPNISS